MNLLPQPELLLLFDSILGMLLSSSISWLQLNQLCARLSSGHLLTQSTFMGDSNEWGSVQLESVFNPRSLGRKGTYLQLSFSSSGPWVSHLSPAPAILTLRSVQVTIR
ncbi:hypothetical protein DFS33DRAFT_1299712 [Desarmillaria ectypa]|nr:hypothetical protein DFS33DRAFT_1299712 [Desarmillaria ectypa]